MLSAVEIILSILFPIVLIAGMAWAAMKYGSQKTIDEEMRKAATTAQENKDEFEKVVSNRPFTGSDAIERLRKQGHID